MMRTIDYTFLVPIDFASVFHALKPALATQASRFSVGKDVPHEYALVTKSPSPYPQHKGQPISGAARICCKGRSRFE